MNQYIRNLLTLVIAAISAVTITPCQAKTPTESNKENTNNISNNTIIPVSSQTTATMPSTLSDSARSTNNKPVILSEETSTTVAAPKPNSRIPISSRIFAAPSMRQ